MILASLRMNSRLRRLTDVGAGLCLGVAGALAASSGAREAAENEPIVAESRPQAAAGVRALALSVIDGDTFEARVTLFPGQEIVTRIWIAGVDAPELHGRCARETEAAQAARQELAGLVEGRQLTHTALRGDKYFGRVLTRVSSPDTGDVSDALIAAGAGRSYSGGKRGGWC